MDFFAPALAGLMVPILLIAGTPLFIYVYAIIRWRAGAGGEPGLGSYALVLMFRLFAVLLGLCALSLLLYSFMSSNDLKEMTRVCWPVLIASLLFLVVQFVVGSALGPGDRFVAARRIFGGGLVAVSGMIMFGALVALLVTYWEEVPDDPESRGAKNHTDQIKAFGSWLFCFGTVYLASAVKMARAAGEGMSRGFGTPTTP
ncbi:MAG: hypothetical protein ACHQ1G_06175 [Planctomycetota bacterium]